jgi:hypothetical protein
MRFRPTFCAHCGERIVRSDWRFYTSRRFCAVCESEYKGQDLLVPAFMSLCLVVGLTGIGTYLLSGPTPEYRVSREPQRFVEKQQPTSQLSALKQPSAEANTTFGQEAQIQAPPHTYAQNQSPAEPYAPPSAPVGAAPPVMQRPAPREDQTVHYCGAQTKNGTPCARRVKGPTRCFQHVGMPAMSVATEPALAANGAKNKEPK